MDLSLIEVQLGLVDVSQQPPKPDFRPHFSLHPTPGRPLFFWLSGAANF